jgi:hypothetical protein
MLPLGLTAYKLSLFPPGVSIEANTSEIYHSGIKLDDPITKQKTHDYLLLSSPRKARRVTTARVQGPLCMTRACLRVSTTSVFPGQGGYHRHHAADPRARRFGPMARR